MQSNESQSQIVLFESSDGTVTLDVTVDSQADEVWLNRAQMAMLFDRDVKTIGKHISNALKEELNASDIPTVAKFATVQTEGNRQVERDIEYYNLDVIMSVGYRVKSQRGIEFRRWANDVLRRYIIEGRAENEFRLQQLSHAVSLLERISDNLDTSQVLEIVKSFAPALDLLDDYDHQRVSKPSGKAANLLYFVVKNHSFHDGNKRIAATMFLYFLEKNVLALQRRPKGYKR